ncbi:hypothetical protein QOZ80_1AG0031030 [Eleusine coracana subsp. coracana]|nr:hypothetical protein QOZ80_1AG0031030 [Eleusine coracana subsp. coracana]
MELVEARGTAAASFGICSHPPNAMGYRHPYSAGSGSAYYDDAAAAFSPAAFGAVRRPPAGPSPPPLDVFDYMPEDEGVRRPAAVPATTTFVPDAVGAYGHAATSSRSAAAAGEGPATTMTTDRIAFRMRSDEEVLDDGYKWRKYGKKSVKNSPNPRNYYRCSTEGCNVKKRVERDRDDPTYVVTMYDGVHNHVSPGTVYYATQDAASGRFFVAGMHPGP